MLPRADTHTKKAHTSRIFVTLSKILLSLFSEPILSISPLAHISLPRPLYSSIFGIPFWIPLPINTLFHITHFGGKGWEYMAVSSTATGFPLCMLRNQIERQIYDHKESQVTTTIKDVRIQSIRPQITKPEASNTYANWDICHCSYIPLPGASPFNKLAY